MYLKHLIMIITLVYAKKRYQKIVKNLEKNLNYRRKDLTERVKHIKKIFKKKRSWMQNRSLRFF